MNPGGFKQPAQPLMRIGPISMWVMLHSLATRMTHVGNFTCLHFTWSVVRRFRHIQITLFALLPRWAYHHLSTNALKAPSGEFGKPRNCSCCRCAGGIDGGGGQGETKHCATMRFLRSRPKAWKLSFQHQQIHFMAEEKIDAWDFPAGERKDRGALFYISVIGSW